MHHLRPFTAAPPLLPQVAQAMVLHSLLRQRRTKPDATIWTHRLRNTKPSKEDAQKVNQVRNCQLATMLRSLLLIPLLCCRQIPLTE